MTLIHPLQTPKHSKQPHHLNHTHLKNPDVEILVVELLTVGSQGIATNMGPKWGSIFLVKNLFVRMHSGKDATCYGIVRTVTEE